MLAWPVLLYLLEWYQTTSSNPSSSTKQLPRLLAMIPPYWMKPGEKVDDMGLKTMAAISGPKNPGKQFIADLQVWSPAAATW